jgi:hypothetical protein
LKEKQEGDASPLLECTPRVSIGWSMLRWSDAPASVPQQYKSTTLGEDKNKNGKRIPKTVKETQIIGKKARKLNKNKAKLENLQEVKETRWKTSQPEPRGRQVCRA